MDDVTVRSRVEADLRAALAARDRATAATLREAMAILANAEAVPLVDGRGRTEVARRELDDDVARALLRKEADERTESAAVFAEHGRPERAAELAAQVEVLRRYT